MKRIAPCVAIGLVVVLAGCGKQVSPAGSGSSAPAGSAAPARAGRDVPPEAVAGNGMLRVRPGAIDRCAARDGAAAVEVQWDATRARTEGVHVYLHNPGESRKLWSTAGAVGKETTGPWMRDGSTVTLVNATDGHELAQVTLRDVACD